MTDNLTVFKLLESTEKLFKTKNIASPRLDSELLLAHCLNKNRLDLYLNLSNPVSSEKVNNFIQLANRRAEREPVSYIVGHKEFWSLKLAVNRNVLIPRPETEILVEKTLAIINREMKNYAFLKLLDIGTGSGAVSIALSKEAGNLMIFTVDKSKEALDIALKNIKTHNCKEKIKAFCGDTAKALKKTPFFDIVVSNPPYIASDEIEKLEPEISIYEPRTALDGGEDGLAFYQDLAEQTPLILKKNGWLVMEIGESQGEEVKKILAADNAFDVVEIIKDYSERDRVITARKK